MEVLIHDSGYADWIGNSDFDNEIREIGIDRKWRSLQGRLLITDKTNWYT